jgi:hypothetical protein
MAIHVDVACESLSTYALTRSKSMGVGRPFAKGAKVRGDWGGEQKWYHES